MSEKQDPQKKAPPPKKPAPQRIPARGDSPAASPTSSARGMNSPHVSRRWIFALLAALLVIAAIGVAGYVYLSGDRAEETARADIESTVVSFTDALTTGDLATLRSSSCGELATYYRDIADDDFADVHRVAVDQGNIPVVDRIDAVQITGDTAIAQVIAYTEANPSESSPRTFDLRLEGEEWKVC